MSIENNIKRIADALEAIASHITADKQPGSAAAAAAPSPPDKGDDQQPPPPPPPATDATPAAVVTLADLNTAMVAKAGAMGDNGAAIFAMLQAQYSAAGLNQLPEDKYTEVLDQVNALGA